VILRAELHIHFYEKTKEKSQVKKKIYRRGKTIEVQGEGIIKLTNMANVF
jgi:hypothetical protein